MDGCFLWCPGSRSWSRKIVCRIPFIWLLIFVKVFYILFLCQCSVKRSGDIRFIVLDWFCNVFYCTIYWIYISRNYFVIVYITSIFNKSCSSLFYKLFTLWVNITLEGHLTLIFSWRSKTIFHRYFWISNVVWSTMKGEILVLFLFLWVRTV